MPKVDDDDDDGGQQQYWEVEGIRDERKRNGVQEFLVKWKNFREETWEPEDNLCDWSLAEGRALIQARNNDNRGGSSSNSNNKRKNLKGQPKLDTATTSNKKPRSIRSSSSKPPPAHHASLKWQAPKDHVTFQKIERIHVDSPHAAQRVTNARMNGIPCVLVGHKGWANFARRWLNPCAAPAPDGENIRSKSNTEDANFEYNNDLQVPLDLAVPHEVDATKMKQDIGDEVVPVLRYAYNEQDPIRDELKVSEFLEQNWNKKQTVQKQLYLHQWQFPRSDTAVPKLCYEESNHPLDSVLGIDLLKYWDDDIHDNPYQYLFMGGAQTRSKMHKDDGGFLITIAPIVGEKEVVLAHRSDGPGCLYHLDANVNRVDLVNHPLMSWARLWKSVIKPGEILLMPQGTYHQCRNITPCLSYTRFFLDVVNLRAFYESYIHEDAPETDHDAIVWNACTDLIDKVEEYTMSVRESKKGNSVKDSAPFDINRAAFTLSKLLLIAREFTRHHKEELGKSQWAAMTEDIESALHSFQYRLEPKVPAFQAQVDEKKTIKADKSNAKDNVMRHQSPGKVSLSALSAALKRTPKVPPLQEDDHVHVRFLGRNAFGRILEIKPAMSAAFVRYFGHSDIEDEYVAFDKLKIPIPGESGAPFCPEQIKKDMLVIYYDEGEEYRASIQHWRTTTFYKIRIELDRGKFHVVRWLPRDVIGDKVVPEGDSTVDLPEGEDVASEEPEARSILDCQPEYFEVEEVPRPARRRSECCHAEEAKNDSFSDSTLALPEAEDVPNERPNEAPDAPALPYRPDFFEVKEMQRPS